MTSMTTTTNVQGPDVSVEEGLSHQLVMRVLKLRWMGMEDEARQMQAALHRADAACTVPTEPYATDQSAPHCASTKVPGASTSGG